MSTKQYRLCDYEDRSRDLQDDAVAAFRHFHERVSPGKADVKLSGMTWQLYTEAAEERTLWMSNNDGGVSKCGCHGNYAEVLRRFDDRTLRVKRGHPQQRGVEIARVGSTCEIVRQSDLTIVDTNRVETITDLNSETADITFEHPLPPEIGAGYAVEDMDFQPDLTIEDCVFKHSKPRGALIMTAGKVRVRRSYFAAPGPAIKVIGCADRVYESGHIRDMVVEDCQFVECCKSPQWGPTPLLFTPEIHHNETRTEGFHRNVIIRNNVFERCAGGMIESHSVDNLVLENNRELPIKDSVKE